MDLFCNKCTLQFDKKYVFDLHLSLVHGEKMAEIKVEPLISEDNFQELQASEPFDKKYVFDQNLSLLRGEKMAEIRIEPLISEVAKTSEQVISDHVLDTGLKCNRCSSLFKTKWIKNIQVAAVHEHIWF